MDRAQDFTKKVVIAVRPDLPQWQAMNAIAHCAAYFGNAVGKDFGTGETFITKDGAAHPRNAQYPIVVVRAEEKELRELMREVRSSGLCYLGFIREMIETTDDSEIEKILARKNDGEIEYLAIGVFGDKENVSARTKRFSLWK